MDQVVQKLSDMKDGCQKMIDSIRAEGKNPLTLQEWCGKHHDELIRLVQNPEQFLTLKMQQLVKPLKQFDPVQQPQDVSDLLAGVVKQFFEQIEEISAEIRILNRQHIKIHARVEAEKHIRMDYMKQLLQKQKEIMRELGEDNDIPDDEAQQSMMIQEPPLIENKQSKEIEELNQQYRLQVVNVERISRLLFEYSKQHKLKSTQSLKILNMLQCQQGEKCWPTPNELSMLSLDQLKNLQVCTLRIIQKNSQRSRGEEWGHAFFLQLRLDQGILSPLIGQDEWESQPQSRPELQDYSMRDLNKIGVSFQEGMVVAVFFYVKGQENYKNVLASAECFAGINYDQMLKDPESKNCTLKFYEIKNGQRFVGIRYKENNQKPSSRYFTFLEPIIWDKID